MTALPVDFPATSVTDRHGEHETSTSAPSTVTSRSSSTGFYRFIPTSSSDSFTFHAPSPSGDAAVIRVIPTSAPQSQGLQPLQDVLRGTFTLRGLEF